MHPTPPNIHNARLQSEYLPTCQLSPTPGAPRRHPKSQIKSLNKSLEAFGQVLPILIDGDDQILSGQALWEAAKALNLAEVMVIRIDYLSQTQAKGLMIALNRIGELSSWDEQALGTILLELSSVDLDFNLEASGFTAIEIDLKIEGLGEEANNAEDEAPIIVGEGPTVCRPGDVWRLGEHLLICGDARDPAVFKALMGEENADLVVTDPPYNVKVDGHVSGGGRHRHRPFAMASGEMSTEGFTNFLGETMTLAHQFSRSGSLHYWAMDWRHIGELLAAGTRVYERYINMAVWVKNQAGQGSFLRSQHELFFLFAKGGVSFRNNVQLGRFGRSRSNVWRYPSAASLARTSEEGSPLAMHPTVKPLALIADILLDSTLRGEIVLDPFAGSGTSLIAAEKLGRKARCIEIDPAYCDTILGRWRRWTGEEPVRLEDGTLFGALEAAAAEDIAGAREAQS